MTRHLWTDAEVALLRQHYATRLTADLAAELGRPIQRVLAKANNLGLRKTRELIAATARERMADPKHGGRASQFKPGAVPVNKGIKHPPGWAPGRMAEAQFKPGNQPYTTLPIGSYRIHEGYLERKVSNAKGNASKRWHGVQRLVWEAANGPTPPGHVVVFRPGRHSTVLEQITLDAVELISRAELMRRNTRHNYGPEINELISLRARITRAVHTREKATP